MAGHHEVQNIFLPISYLKMRGGSYTEQSAEENT
jgi:hypothetical protein